MFSLQDQQFKRTLAEDQRFQNDNFVIQLQKGFTKPPALRPLPSTLHHSQRNVSRSRARSRWERLAFSRSAASGHKKIRERRFPDLVKFR
jgi:hypothetical protein